MIRVTMIDESFRNLKISGGRACLRGGLGTVGFHYIEDAVVRAVFTWSSLP